MINQFRIYCALICLIPFATKAVTLADLEWQSRPLLIFSSDHYDKTWLSTRERLNLYQCELEDRNIVFGNLFINGESTLSGQPISPDYALELRQQFKVDEKEFTVILIGKDGIEKYRSNTAPAINELLGLIDRMPMRQIEIKQNPGHCN